MRTQEEIKEYKHQYYLAHRESCIAKSAARRPKKTNKIAYKLDPESTGYYGKTHPLRGRWEQMKRRCYFPSCPAYKNYGARGITMDEIWRGSFKAFCMDVEPTYSPGLELDRIDNDKGYFAENVRWVTRKVNANNKRNNRFLEYQGIRKTVPQWAESFGLKTHTITERLDRGKWSVEKALTTPVRSY